MKFLFSVFFASSLAFAADKGRCKGLDYWVASGKMIDMTVAYEKELKDIFASGKDVIKKLNQLKDKKGVPISGALSDSKADGTYKDYFSGDGIGGIDVLFFTKSTKLKKGTSIALDPTYEVKEPDSKIPLKTWQLPYERPIVAIKGDQIFVDLNLDGVCIETGAKIKLVLGVKTNGDLEISDAATIPTSEQTTVECTARKIIENSSYSNCVIMTDANSKAKRIIVYQGPMT